MRVTSISVKHLFNTFDHSVHLNLGERITIIHGLNGLGKTTLLRMVKGLCSGRYSQLWAVPFSELKLDFDDGSSVVATKDPADLPDVKRSKKQQPFIIKYLQSGVEEGRYQLPRPPDSPMTTEVLMWLDSHIPGLDRMRPGTWRYVHSPELLRDDEVLELFGELLPEQLTVMPTNAPPWMQRLSEGISVRLIETQRLVMGPLMRARPEYAPPGIGSAIVMHSSELASKIAKQESEYGALSQSLDRTFPMRYVLQKAKMSMSEEELRNRFQNLESKRAGLEEAGLLGKESTGFELPVEMDEATRGVMSVYVTDMEKKLHVFDDLAARIDLLREIVNDHFRYKVLRVSKKKGFQFFSTRTGEELDATDFSSGEQHEAVLLYEFLFHVQDNSLVMIDEPEISLHIAWQEEFLRDLRRIIKLSPFDAVIATHSPEIVNDRWDLTVELSGPEEDRK